jgi:hypothetical protein
MNFSYGLDRMIDFLKEMMSVATPGNGTSGECAISGFECWQRLSNHGWHGGKYLAMVRADWGGFQEADRVFFATTLHRISGLKFVLRARRRKLEPTALRPRVPLQHRSRRPAGRYESSTFFKVD